MIDRATVQRIKDAADIVDIVGDYVSLTRRGANYMGLCPFHNERTPSFSVSKSRNFCHCFSCHKGGSPISFIMEKEGISYHDALLHIAKKYGIKVEEKELTEEEKEKMSLREGMFVANEWSMHFFEDTLHNDNEGKEIGLQYLYQRGITTEAIKNFHLGFASENSLQFIEDLKKKGFNVETFKSLGLVGTSSQGRNYNRFYGRVIFPVLNSSGKVIAFGGRDLKGGPAKYINSPESEIYKKSNELYGIFQAKSAIASEDRCYLVEGYLDVISMWQSGIKNVVASSGTALTDGQITLIHRFTKNVTLIYDGDAAGIKAALRGIDMLLSHKLDLNVLLLPDGEDPDSFSKKLGPEEFRKYVNENQTDIIRFKAKVLAEDTKNDPQKRVLAIHSIVNTLAVISDRVKRDVYVQECSNILGVSEESLISEIARASVSIKQNEILKRERAKLVKEFPIDYQDNERNNTLANHQGKTNNSGTNNPLRPLEWKILEYCLKYGFLDLWDEENENGQIVHVNTLQFVNDELLLDEISFSEPDFLHTFNVLKAAIPQFIEDKKDFIESLKIKEKEKRAAVYEEIAQNGLSISEIKKRELNLDEEMAEWVKKEIDEFCKIYSIREFASHEDALVRNLAGQAFSQKHILSNIFTRDGNRVETEETKLLSLVLTSINVLKNGILDQKLKKLLDQLRNTPSDEVETHQEINLKIASIIQARKQMAKDIGDRVISPK